MFLTCFNWGYIMKFKAETIFILVLILFLQGCSEASSHNLEKSPNAVLTSEIHDKISQKNAYLSVDLLFIPSLFTQAQSDNSLEVYPDGNGLRYNYKGKIISPETSLCYDEIAVEITPLDGLTIEEVITAFSDTFDIFKINGNKCCAIFVKNEDAKQTVVNLLFFTPTETGKCFIATRVGGLLDSTKGNVEKIYKDFMLTSL